MNLCRLGWLAVASTLSVAAGAAQYELTPDAPPVYGTDQHVAATYEETLLDIARRNSVGYEEIQRANPKLDLWIPGAGADVLIPGERILPPGPHEGIVVNLPEHRLYYYPKPRPHEKPVVITYPVSVGKMDWRTPLGQTQIVSKQTLPNWYPPRIGHQGAHRAWRSAAEGRAAGPRQSARRVRHAARDSSRDLSHPRHQ